MAWVLSNGVEDTPLQQFLLGSLYLFDSIFSGIVLIDRLHNCVKEIASMFNKETAKRKNGLDWMSTEREKKVQPSKNYILRKRAQKLKNIYT